MVMALIIVIIAAVIIATINKNPPSTRWAAHSETHSPATHTPRAFLDKRSQLMPRLSQVSVSGVTRP